LSGIAVEKYLFHFSPYRSEGLTMCDDADGILATPLHVYDTHNLNMPPTKCS
jgi:hypothetical protein